MAKKKSKGKKKKGTAKQRKAWAKAGRRLKAWNRKHGHKKKKDKKKKSKKKHGHAKKKSKKKKGGRKHGHRKIGFGNYKAAAARKAQLAVIKAKLVAKGMPPHLVKKMMARISRASSAKKTKSTGWFAKRDAKEAAERAAAYIEKSYATPISYV